MTRPWVGGRCWQGRGSDGWRYVAQGRRARAVDDAGSLGAFGADINAGGVLVIRSLLSSTQIRR